MTRALAALVGVALFLLGLVSPLPEAAVALAAQGSSGGLSVRALNYDFTYERMQGDQAYERVLAGTPASVRSLYLLGSSDFGMDFPQNPRRLLQEHSADFDLYFSGRGGTQPLTQAIELGSLREVRGGRVAVIVSPQWFGPTGISAHELGATLSTQRLATMLANPRVSDDLKRAVVHRLAAVDASLCAGSVPCSEWGVAASWLSVPLRPLVARTAALRETWDEVRVLNQYNGPYAVGPRARPMASFDFDAAWAEADRQGRAASSNELFLDDDVHERLSGAIATRRTHFPTAYHPAAPGYDDLQLLLDVARQTGVEVLLVSSPLHGVWMDKVGYPAGQRARHYARMRALATAHGVHLADHSGYEYEPYFFGDLIHLGRKGWLLVVRDCYRFAR